MKVGVQIKVEGLGEWGSGGVGEWGSGGVGDSGALGPLFFLYPSRPRRIREL